MRKLAVEVSTERVKAFCKKWKVKEFSLFGSVLTKEFGPASDIDVLVDLERGHGLTLYDWLDMMDELREMFGRHVDLVAKRGVKNPFRRREILRSAEVVYVS